MTNQNRSLAGLKATYLPLLKSAKASDSRETFRSLGHFAHEFRLKLSPLSQKTTSEAGISVWLVHARAGEMAFHAALAAADFQLEYFKTPDEIGMKLGTAKPKLLLISMEYIDQLPHIHKAQPDLKVILLATGEMKNGIDYLRADERICHLVFEQTLESPFMQRDLIVTCEKMVSGNIFGLEKYLDFGVPIVQSVIRGNDSRRQALEQLESRLSRAGLSSVLVRKARHLADELLMNAIYDAPVDQKTKTPRYNHLTRAVNVELDPSEYAYFRYGFDGYSLAISIEDPFGALPRDTILKYVKSCFDGEFGKLNESLGKGGGGMGLYQILSSADLLVANVAKGQRTELIALVNVHERLPMHSHSFHYFSGQIQAPKIQSSEDKVLYEYLPKVIDEIQALSETGNVEALGRMKDLLQKIESLPVEAPEASVHDHPVLLISPNKRLQRIFRGLIGTGHADTTIYEEEKDIPKGHSAALCIIDDTMCSDVATLQKRFQASTIISVSDRDAQWAIEELRLNKDLKQVLSFDLPKFALQRLMLTHVTRLLRDKPFDVGRYLSFGAKLKTLHSTALEKMPRPPAEVDRLQLLYKALIQHRTYDSQVFGHDPQLFLFSARWKEKTSRSSLLETYGPDSLLPEVRVFYENAHAIVLSSDGQNNELTLIRFASSEEIEPFLYTFLNA